MKRIYFIILVVTMVLASIGLVVVQVVQTHRSVKISRNLFNVSVNNAMDHVVTQFDQMKLDDYVSSADRAAIRIYRRYEELNDRMIELVSRNEELFYNEREVKFGTVLQDSAFIRRRVRLSRSDSNTLRQYNTLLNARNNLMATNASSMARMDKRVLSSDEVFLSDFNYPLLDSLVRVELILGGVAMSPEIAVQRASGDDWLYLSDSSEEELLRDSPFRYNLHLGGLPTIDDYYLVLAFHASDVNILTSQRFDMVTSLLLIAILVALFLVCLRIIRNLKSLDEMKNTFINNMTHELKTPIATISLTTEMLRDETVTLDEPTRHRFLTVVKDEAHRMQVLIETILQSSKMSNRQYAINPVSVNLHTLIHDVANSFSLQIENRGGSLQLNLCESPAIVEGDKLHLTNMIYNLVDNAVKYSDGAPQIILTTWHEASRVCLSVQDHGIGIKAEDQKHIFEKFYRVSTGNIHNVKGFGIGLNYVSQVVALHHGKIQVESQPGEGSTFRVTLPVEEDR